MPGGVIRTVRVWLRLRSTLGVEVRLWVGEYLLIRWQLMSLDEEVLAVLLHKLRQGRHHVPVCLGMRVCGCADVRMCGCACLGTYYGKICAHSAIHPPPENYSMSMCQRRMLHL